MITERITVRLLKRPIRGVPVGGELVLPRMQARALVLTGLAEYMATTSKRMPQRTRTPRKRTKG